MCWHFWNTAMNNWSTFFNRTFTSSFYAIANFAWSLIVQWKSFALLVGSIAIVTNCECIFLKYKISLNIWTVFNLYKMWQIWKFKGQCICLQDIPLMSIFFFEIFSFISIGDDEICTVVELWLQSYLIGQQEPSIKIGCKWKSYIFIWCFLRSLISSSKD